MRPWTLIRITLYASFSFLILDYVNPSLKVKVAQGRCQVRCSKKSLHL